MSEVGAGASAAPRASYRTLGELLGRWARLEPACCRAQGDLYAAFAEGRWQAVCGRDHRTLPGGYGALWTALQDALAARAQDWSLTVCRGQVVATVSVAGGTVEVSTHSEAMSLLWAYLDALEASTPPHMVA